MEENMTNNQQQAVELEAMRGKLPQTAEAWAFALAEACNAAATAGAKADSDTFLEAVRAIQRQTSRATKGQDGVVSAAKEALEFYADPIRYARVHPAADSRGAYAASDVMFDQGKRAKEALAALQQAKGQGGCHE